MSYIPTSNDFVNWQNESVSDPAANNTPSDTGYLNSLFKTYSPQNNPVVNGILGAGDALRNTIASGTNLIPGVNIPMAKTGQGTAYNVGNVLGNVGAFMGGGEVLDTARLGAEELPYVGKLAQLLGNNPIANRAVGTALYGVAENPNNRAMGGAEGVGGSLLAETLPYGLGKVAQASNYFRPNTYMQSILNGLGGGQNLEDATKSVLNSVKNSYESQLGAANDLYNPVYNIVRDRDIYNQGLRPDPNIFGTPINKGQYQNLPPKVFENYSNDLDELHQNFLNNPTFDNAHKLQSQLGVESAKLKEGSGSPDVSTINAISSLNKARTALKGDMSSFLNNESSNLAQQYNDASDYFKNNVVPYRANQKIFDIATGDLTNVKPSSLANIFASPSDNVSTVINDMPQESINNLLYTKLGQRVPSSNPDAFMRNFNSLPQQGLGSYISPELQTQVSNLQNRMNARNSLQMALGGLLGAGASAGHGGAPVSVGLGLLGAGIGKPIMNYASSRLPLEQLANSITNVTRGTYPYAKDAVLANILNGANQ